MQELVRNIVRAFCCEFARNPYLCYTGNGQHAHFYSMLLAALPEGARTGVWRGQRVNLIQKEYPTATSLGKPKRQHWDIALLKKPLVGERGAEPGYDFFPLDAVVEFGMNEAFDHLIDDVERISHFESNVDYGFLVHLHRISDAKTPFSRRDWSPASARIAPLDSLVAVVEGKPVEIWYAVADLTGTRETGVWLVQSARGLAQTC